MVSVLEENEAESKERVEQPEKKSCRQRRLLHVEPKPEGGLHSAGKFLLSRESDKPSRQPGSLLFYGNLDAILAIIRQNRKQAQMNEWGA